jgi:putative transposase
MNTTSLIPDQVYHVYSHATGDDNFFRSDENYRYFLQKYQKHILPIADTYAYCLMPNHFHFMIRIRGEEELMKYFKKRKSMRKPTRFTEVDSSNEVNITSRGKTFNTENLVGLISRQFSNFFNAYSKAFNKMYGRRGALFRERFRRKHVDNDSYFTGLIAYIHHNPVYHGFVKQLNDWSWSSWPVRKRPKYRYQRYWAGLEI